MTIKEKDAFEYYKLAIAARDLELKFFWQRSLFFAGFIAAIFLAFQSADKTSTTQTNTSADIFRPLLLILGGLFSLAWTLANRGSKYWYESWETKIDEYEKTLGVHFFRRWVKPQTKPRLYKGRLYSVSKIAIYLSDVTFVAWLILIVHHYQPSELVAFFGYSVAIRVFVIIVLALILLLLFGTRTTVPDEVTKQWRESK